jgi:GGDEF domain-containing protein
MSIRLAQALKDDPSPPEYKRATAVDKLRILEQKQQVEKEKQHWRDEAHRLTHEVLRDPLTDVYNRSCLEKELALRFRRARRRGTVLGLIFLDLDEFKSVNDRFGHLFGDRVLKETADSLCAAVRHGDIVARYGRGG